MTRRERLERKAELRREWAEKREQRANAAYSRASAIGSMIPMGQPILVGHHSEKRHRADLNKIDNAMRDSVESSKMAEHHESKADGIERQLATSIFSDDPDAVEALEAKAAAIDAECETMKAANKAFKKAKGAAGWAAGLPDAEKHEADAVALFRICPYHKQPYPSYALTNARANARRLRERIKIINGRKERAAQAEAAGGCMIVGEEYVNVVFSEKPDRAIINAMKAAGFHWNGGSWGGYRKAVPECVLSLVGQQGRPLHEN